MRCFFKDRTKEWGPVTEEIAGALKNGINQPDGK
jgi:hypothetical protein